MTTLKKILELDAEMSRIGVERDKLRAKYIKENCPYKKGQKIVMKPKFGQQENGIIAAIYFETHSPFIKGMVSLNVRPMTNDWKPKLRRANVVLQEDSEIIKVIE